MKHHANEEKKKPNAPAIRRFWMGCKSLLIPQSKWDYAMHAVVILVALSYWIASFIKWPDASWAEIIMYRPNGDCQVWPIITALSHFNFGDPADAFNYGKGVGGFHAVILMPHALAYALLGGPGYMVMDVMVTWLYFMLMSAVFKRLGFSSVTSMVVGAFLATGALQNISVKIGQSLDPLLALAGQDMAEYDFPNLFGLALFNSRIPRPMLTEPFAVVVLGILFQICQTGLLPSFRKGVLLGVLMSLLMQGDPFTFGALGLFTLFIILWLMVHNKWTMPWGFILGEATGVLAASGYFLFQLFSQHPDSAKRFGLAVYSRSSLVLLPEYAPALRVLIVLLLSGIVLHMAKKHSCRKQSRENLADGARGTAAHAKHHLPETPDSVRQTKTPAENAAVAARFFTVLMAAGWLAQPIQLLLLGKGAQIYHYHLYMLPALYSYSVLILVMFLVKLVFDDTKDRTSISDHERTKKLMLFVYVVAFGAILMFGIESPVNSAQNSRTPRPDNSPWEIHYGDQYREGYRALEKEFRSNGQFKSAHTFATFNHEVYFMLAGFHEKRAYLPDNAFTTLSDEILEERICQVGKIFSLNPDVFIGFIQNSMIMNFWLGCAKYWCASDYKYAPENDYEKADLEKAAALPKHAPFNLALPRSEAVRLKDKYIGIVSANSDITKYPDLIINTRLLRDLGLSPNTQLYREIYTNKVFIVYEKIM